MVALLAIWEILLCCKVVTGAWNRSSEQYLMILLCCKTQIQWAWQYLTVKSQVVFGIKLYIAENQTSRNYMLYTFAFFKCKQSALNVEWLSAKIDTQTQTKFGRICSLVNSYGQQPEIISLKIFFLYKKHPRLFSVSKIVSVAEWLAHRTCIRMIASSNPVSGHPLVCWARVLIPIANWFVSGTYSRGWFYKLKTPVTIEL